MQAQVCASSVARSGMCRPWQDAAAGTLIAGHQIMRTTADAAAYVSASRCCSQSKEAQKLGQRIALAEEQFDQGLRKLTAASKQLASLKRQVGV